jgi:hypothetical protein
MSYSLLNEEGDLLNYPENSVIGIVDQYADAKATLKDLTAAGFPEDEIGILCGANGTHEVDAEGEEHGVLGKIARVIREFGDVDNPQKERHEHELSQGHFMIAVRAEKEDRRNQALNILKSHGGHFINFYSPWVIENLAP